MAALREVAVLALISAAPLATPGPVQAEQRDSRRLELRGQVVIPEEARLRRRRITLTVQHVATGFHSRTQADSSGRFRFKKLPAGTYSLSILIPGAAEIQQTLNVTPSFADSRGRVVRDFVFDEAALAQAPLPPPQGMVSVRQLSIPYRARRHYADARKDMQRQKPESARRHLLKAIEMAPQFAEALNYLGVLSYQQREFADAEDYFRRALEADPDGFEPLVNLGGALLAMGRAEEAVEYNQRAQEMQPRDALTNAQLGLSYYLLGNDEEALNYLLLTEQLDPAHFSNPQIPVANIYLRNGQPELALEELQDFLERHPDSPEAGSVLAMLENIRAGRAGGAAAKRD